MTHTRVPLPFDGTYRITKMEVWGPDYLDLIVPAFIRFDAEGLGEFQFGAVRGWLDCRPGMREGEPAIEFSWQGDDDGDDACGRGWAIRRDGDLAGRIYIHVGDDSDFSAVPYESDDRTAGAKVHGTSPRPPRSGRRPARPRPR